MIYFINNGSKEEIADFTIACEKCGNKDVVLDYDFNYYGGATGYDFEIAIICDECGTSWTI